MHSISSFVTKHRPVLILLGVYLFIHLINLTLLPIFNDEAIYLDWAWQFTRNPGHLYDSLADSKQPLMIWVFAIFETFFSDPLMAGRLASVLIGAVTLVGIYRIAKHLFSPRVALIAAGVYAITPLFVFYNRQALMEAGVMCIGIWTGYALLRIVTKPNTNTGFFLGSIAGIGFFIKSSSLLFTIAASLVICFILISKRNAELIKAYAIAAITFCGVDFLLFINPLFWQTFHTNDRYSYSLSELLQFPLVSWFSHALGVFEIGIIFLTPGIFLFGLWGLYVLFTKRDTLRLILFGYFLLALGLEILTVRGQSLRYLVAFLPFLTISAACIIEKLWQGNTVKKGLVVLFGLVSLLLTCGLLFRPDEYILQMAKLTHYAETTYVLGQTSGYGVSETMQYIRNHSNPQRATMIFFAWNVGNPENAVDIYSLKEPTFYPLILDRRFIENLESYACLSADFPVFYVTRNNELGGFEKYMTELTQFPSRDPHYAIRIYGLRKPCTGQTLSLPLLYKDRIQAIDAIR